MTLLASAEGAEILIQHPTTDWRPILRALHRLDVATRDRNAVIGKVPNQELRQYTAAMDEAQAEVDELFTRTLSIDEAERMYGHLGGSIVKAKVHRGDFNQGEDE